MFIAHTAARIIVSVASWHRWLIVSMWNFISRHAIARAGHMPHLRCHDGNVPCLCSTSCYFRHHLIVVSFFISPVAIVLTTHGAKFNTDAAATSLLLTSTMLGKLWCAIACCMYITFLATAPWPLLPLTLYCHPGACCCCCHDCCLGHVAGWCRCHCAIAIVIAIAIAIPSPSLSPLVDCSFYVFISLLLSSLLLSPSPPVWHVSCIEQFLKLMFLRSKISQSIKYLFSSPGFPIFLYVLSTSRSGWPAKVKIIMDI